MRPTEALTSVKFWRISPIIFILHKWSSDIFNASWYYKEFSNSGGGGGAPPPRPQTPLATPAFLGWPFGLATALKCIARTNVTGPFWDYKNHNAGYCLSHELRLVAFVPTSLPWVFFSLLVGHLDLIGNHSRWYTCVGSIPIWNTGIFSTQLPASMVEKSSFSCIHQAQNSPSHLF